MRCGGLGQADARLITIGEPNAGRLQCALQSVDRRLLRIRPVLEPPHLFAVEPPRPRIEAVRIVDMSASNSWASSQRYSGVPTPSMSIRQRLG